MIYADHPATTPALPEVAEAVARALIEGFGNPSARHHPQGRAARGIIDQARSQVAQLVAVNDEEVVFTSGATEALNQAIIGVAERSLATRPRFVALAVEHPAVREPLLHLATLGADVRWIPPLPSGQPDLAEARALIDDRTALVCAMAVNNETGIIHDLPAIAAIAHAAGALVLCDATQAPMRIPVDLRAWGCDLAALSAHKLHGPKGVGVLWRRRGLALSPLLRGGGQERGWRSGTENVPGIAGFGVAAQLARERLAARRGHLMALTAALESRLRERLPGLRILGTDTNRAPGISLVTLPGLRRGWLAQLTSIAASAGSACASGTGEPSHVLTAMGIAAEVAVNALRIGFAETNALTEIEPIADAMIAGAARLGAAG